MADGAPRREGGRAIERGSRRRATASDSRRLGARLRPPASTRCSSAWGGPALSHRLRGDAARAAHDAARAGRGRGAAHAHRPAARGDAGPHLRGRRRGAVEVVTWEETDDPMALVASRSRTRRARRADLARSPSTTRSGRVRAGAPARAARRARSSLASSVLRRLRMRKDADEVALLRAPPTPRTGSSSRSRRARSSGGRRPTSRARSASGCSPRATSRRSSRSSPRGRTARRPTTTPATGSSRPASRS